MRNKNRIRSWIRIFSQRWTEMSRISNTDLKCSTTCFFDKYNFLYSCRRLLPLILLAIIVFLTIIAAPSGFYAKAKEAGPTTVPANSTTSSNSNSNKQQYCDLYVPPITGSDSPELQDQANMTYRLVYCM
jgi:hypothetical protein